MELRLTRTILERLECSFARQEAKLDRLLGMMATTNTDGRTTDRPSLQAAQCLPQQTQAEQFSTPVPTTQPKTGSCLSVEYTTDIFQGTPMGTPMVDLDRLLDDPGSTGKQTRLFWF